MVSESGLKLDQLKEEIRIHRSAMSMHGFSIVPLLELLSILDPDTRVFVSILEGAVM